MCLYHFRKDVHVMAFSIIWIGSCLKFQLGLKWNPRFLLRKHTFCINENQWKLLPSPRFYAEKQCIGAYKLSVTTINLLLN